MLTEANRPYSCFTTLAKRRKRIPKFSEITENPTFSFKRSQTNFQFLLKRV